MNVIVIHPGDIDSGGRVREHDPRSYEQLVLAEGDSWFSLGGVPAGNVLLALDFRKSTLVVNIADPGDTLVKNIGDPKHMREFRRLVADERFAYKWDFILLSGGGNDLIADAGDVLRRNPPAGGSAADCVDTQKLEKLKSKIQEHFGFIADMRDSSEANKLTPIFAHTYDYPTARNAPAQVLGLPHGKSWLFEAFTAAGIPAALWKDLGDYLLDQLAESILALDCRRTAAPGSLPAPLQKFYAINTRNVLERAAPGTVGSSGDWLNEIHPNALGNRKLAGRLAGEIQSILA
jgi:lysophospholipase L1-like esterase